MIKIAVLHMGGTIAMATNNDTGSVSLQGSNPLQIDDDLLKKYGMEGVRVTSEVFKNIPSPHVDEEVMLELRQRVLSKIAEGADGVVITHGTDTLEEVAYFLDLTIEHSVPIVITGAMRSSNELGSDGLHNLMCSVKVAVHPDSKNKGTMVVLNDEIHAARNVTKINTGNVDTFKSPQFGHIGIVNRRSVNFMQTLIGDEYYPVEQIGKKVILLKAHAGMDGTIFNALLEYIKLDGLVIEALGAGQLPPKTVSSVKAIIDRGIPVVLVSRCLSGVAEPIYDYEGGGKRLSDMGVIFSNGLNGQKARLKLAVVLEGAPNSADIDKAFSN
ncbi:MAG: asparaginase [Defluviitaleaceae bacterium]|nr:asparaginase [Defluviitaleaceae bacterium]